MSCRASAIFSRPSCKGFDTMPLMNGLRSALMVSFILLEASVTGRICIQKLNGSGLCSVSNLIHLGSSRSTMRSFTLPMGVEMDMEFWSNTKSRALRSEEHTSELQSRQYLVCRLLLEKKKSHI